MINQSKVSIQADSKILLDLLSITLGIVFGGAVTLIGLWLWLDFQANPTHSALAVLSANLAATLPASWQVFLGHEAEVMGLPLTGGTKAYWYMARAGGIVSYLLLWLSVVWGLVLSTKIMHNLVPAPLAYGLHEFLSLATMLFVMAHAVVLLGDSYIGFNLFHLTVPFLAPYEPLWTGLGTIGFYLATVLTGSFYIRQQIGQRVWRILHYLTFVAYILALVHGVMAGTDSGLKLMKLLYLTTGGSVLFLIYYRLLILYQKKRGR
jgi:predicted ferric reductase